MPLQCVLIGRSTREFKVEYSPKATGIGQKSSGFSWNNPCLTHGFIKGNCINITARCSSPVYDVHRTHNANTQPQVLSPHPKHTLKSGTWVISSKSVCRGPESHVSRLDVFSIFGGGLDFICFILSHFYRSSKMVVRGEVCVCRGWGAERGRVVTNTTINLNASSFTLIIKIS